MMISINAISRTILFSVFFIPVFSIQMISQTWMAVDKLTTSDPQALDFFGISVAIDGDYLVAGAWWEDNDPPVNSAGAAYVFKKDDWVIGKKHSN
jgi:hypothetical protein